MLTLICKFQPLAAILIGALFYAVYYWVLRLKTSSAAAQTFIIAAVVVVTLFSFVTPATVVEPPVASMSAVQVPVAWEELRQQPAAAPPTATPPPHSATQGYVATAHPTALPRHLDVSLIMAVYAGGVVLMLLYFISQLLWYARVRRHCQHVSTDGPARVYATDLSQPFSFGQSIFLPKALTGELRHYALVHELCHVRHRHFLKLCLLELLLAAGWYNPFVWLFFGELKLQQELEVDADVLTQGIDRQRYQLSLLQMTVQQSRYLLVQSAFGAKPIKQRIIFMNQSFDTRKMHCRLAAAAASALLVLTAAVAVSCQMNTANKETRHHAIYGVWQMDFTRPADSSEEIYPPFKQYAFYSDDVFFTPHLSHRDGHNFLFGYSGEGLSMRGDTLMGGRGFPIVYRFIDDHTFQSDWTKEGGDLSLANGKVNTDQWSRATPDADLLAVFHAACKAEPNPQRPLDGTWQADSLEDGYERYLFVNDTLALVLYFKCTPDPSVYRFAGEGLGSDVRLVNDSVVRFLGEEVGIHWAADRQSFILNGEGRWQSGPRMRRTETPPHISRILRSTLIENL